MHYIYDAVSSGHISGNGKYTKKCQSLFEKEFGIKKALLTTSCTDALEMCAILLNIEPGDEVIVPSYTFVSSALAFVRQGAVIKFADSRPDNPGIDEDAIENLISPKTKAIVVVHYAGVACNMNSIMDLANRHGIFVIEDAAQGLDSYFLDKQGKKRALGSVGHLATFSFHETKNLQCGEGGLLAINDVSFIQRSEIIWEKGTNRVEFFRGEVNKYGWVDIGSSFLPSEVTAAFLWAQLEKLNEIQAKRLKIWKRYEQNLDDWIEKNKIQRQFIPNYATNNAHMFYLVLPSIESRDKLITRLKDSGIMCVFHYQSLHSSSYYSDKYDGKELKHSDRYSNCLLRLPLHYDLGDEDVDYICDQIKKVGSNI